MSKKLVSLILTVVLCLSSVLSSYAEEKIPDEILTEVFIRQELFRQYSLIYDTFNAAVTLEDGTEITGIGFTDYSSYYESEEGKEGFFPAGFIADYGYEIPEEEAEKGLVIENLDISDDQNQYVYEYETTPFMEHCVKDGRYLKYGVNEKGAIEYETAVYERGVCDESLGALYSYDIEKFVYDPDMGNYIRINGITLFDQIDFTAIETQMNEIIAKQNTNFSQQDILSTVHIAQEAIVSYLLSMQEETFLGYKVTELVEAASTLDPMQCIRITPDGFVIINMEESPGSADELTKWLVGSVCFILVAGSIALEIFVPAARPLSAAIMGGAINAFIQVVFENKSLNEVQWGKVATAAVSGAMLAWVCPLAAAGAAKAAIQAGASEALGKIAGYGVLTISNSIVSGVTKMVESKIDGKQDSWNAFKIGALIGAASTVAVSALSEFMPDFGSKISQVISRTKAGKWLGDVSNKAARYIQGHQVHLKNQSLENILTPKSVHMAVKSARMELNAQTGIQGGNYKDLVGAGDGTIDKHEIPAHSAYKKGKGLNLATTRDETELPAIKMSAGDHLKTASHGSGIGAVNYRIQQAAYIAKDDMTSAIWMDVHNIKSLFGNKYDEGLKEALTYAVQKGWWKPWTENTGISNQILESLNLTLEELVP